MAIPLAFRCFGSASFRNLPPKRPPAHVIAIISLLFLAALFSGCAEAPSAMDPQGRGAQQIANLSLVMVIIAAVVYVVVMALLVGALFRRRAEPDIRDARTPRGSNLLVLISGAAIPAVILIAVFLLTLQTMATLRASADPDRLVIEVIGRQWWWEVRYPDYGFETANELRIPVGEPVELRLISDNVIHSFWVPELHGKVDMIPGRTNTLVLHADRAGQYRGQCAEFCGIQHANMALFVVAEDAGAFADWLALQQLPAPAPADPAALEGQQVFLGSSCVYCHAIRGTNASSDLGPDLTHFASRVSIGSGILPNTRGHLAGWIIDAQSIKPGNMMPPMYLTSHELQALLDYMATLR